MKKIIEGRTVLKIYESGKISKEMPVFYNPVMTENRSISVLITKAYFKKSFRAILPLAASGVRAIRFLKEEVPIKEIVVNDKNRKAIDLFKENLKLNNLSNEGVITTTMDARILLAKEKADYIDIDPFGSPNPFLDIAIQSIRHNGLLAITSTDLSSLAGSYPSTCKWKYWANPIRNHLKHESGLRILIRKIQLIGSQHEKALIPILCYYSKHYYRCFFMVKKSKALTKKIIDNHKYFKYNEDTSITLSTNINDYGPIWVKDLGDKKVIEKAIKIYKESNYLQDKDIEKILTYTLHSLEIDKPFFIDTRALIPILKKQPRIDELINYIQKKGFKAYRTIFSDTGIKTDIEIKELRI